MYNSIYPVNINYSKHNQYRQSGDNNVVQNKNEENTSQNQNNTFPNGTKVAIDYASGQINISQVLTDFRSTILAINAPDDVRDEVYLYLNLVEKESLKENPSREIIVSNLKNASKISDSYIATALNKPSNVVEKWIETLFLQKINLKSNPDEVNPDFKLDFPKRAQERIEAQTSVQNIQETSSINENIVIKEANETTRTAENELKISNNIEEIKTEQELVDVESEIEYSSSKTVIADDIQSTKTMQTPFSPFCQADIKARELFSKAKKTTNDNKGDIEAINLLNEALGIMAEDNNSNQNIKAAIHIERGKIFDNYDYVDYALRDYYEATKANDFNLKAQAFYKSGQIYDEFSEFYPAMDNYLSSVAYSAEADNQTAQSRVLSKIANLYTKQYDAKNALEYGSLAIEAAKNTKDNELIANTYSSDAQNSQYLGDNDRAIDSYKNALSTFSKTNESYEQMAYNYEQAAIVMRKLGNHAKASKLQLKANQYYQRAQLQQSQLEAVS